MFHLLFVVKTPVTKKCIDFAKFIGKKHSARNFLSPIIFYVKSSKNFTLCNDLAEFLKRKNTQILCKSQCGKTRTFSLTEIFFRQINSLLIHLVNSLLSRNFCEKVRKRISEISTMCNLHT